MTRSIYNLLENIKNDSLFEIYPLFFVGGTALSFYIDHRISYDIDIISKVKLPVSAIKTFAFKIGATFHPNPKSSTFKINTGENLEEYILSFTVDDVKLEFFYPNHPIQQTILDKSNSKPYKDGSKLKILELSDIIGLKSFALLNRQKSRDLFDMAVLLENGLITLSEIEKLYSFLKKEDTSLQKYIKGFDDKDDESLDFLPTHKYYKTFAKLTQKERFQKAKELFLNQYNTKKKELFIQKQKEVKKLKKYN